MPLKKSDLSLIKKMDSEIAKADSGTDESILRKYVFKISAGQVVRKAEINATSKKEAEEIMIQRYGDLPFELIEIQ